MALFVLRKLLLQTCMCSHPVGLDVCFLGRPFFYFQTSCEGSGMTARMRRLAWAFAGSLCDKYHNLISWPKCLRCTRKISLLFIQTQCAYIGIGKELCFILQQFTGRKSVRQIAAYHIFYDVSRFLDVRVCIVVFSVKNTRNTCKRLHYSQTFGRIS